MMHQGLQIHRFRNLFIFSQRHIAMIFSISYLKFWSIIQSYNFFKNLRFSIFKMVEQWLLLAFNNFSIHTTFWLLDDVFQVRKFDLKRIYADAWISKSVCKWSLLLWLQPKTLQIASAHWAAASGYDILLQWMQTFVEVCICHECETVPIITVLTAAMAVLFLTHTATLF